MCALSLHDALPIYGELHAHLASCPHVGCGLHWNAWERSFECPCHAGAMQTRENRRVDARSEEHTSELQSRENLVRRLLREKKKYRAGKARTDGRKPSLSRPQ